MNNNSHFVQIAITPDEALLLFASLQAFEARTEEDKFHYAEVIQHDHLNTDNYLDCVCDSVNASILKQRIKLIFGIKDSPDKDRDGG